MTQTTSLVSVKALGAYRSHDEVLIWRDTLGGKASLGALLLVTPGPTAAAMIAEQLIQQLRTRELEAMLDDDAPVHDKLDDDVLVVRLNETDLDGEQLGPHGFVIAASQQLLDVVVEVPSHEALDDVVSETSGDVPPDSDEVVDAVTDEAHDVDAPSPDEERQ